jgi:hypothetical protein
MEPAAVGIAALLLVNIATAAGNAFCESEEFMKSLDRSLPPSGRRDAT